jgi:Trypsin-like peptidase domain
VKTSGSGLRIVSLPRRPDFPSPSSKVAKNDEVVVVGHPWTDAAVMGGVTQASVGLVTKPDGPFPGTKSGIEFTYSTMMGRTGFSGAGVFNRSGEIVGVYQGSDPTLGVSFVNLGMTAQAFNVMGMRPVSNRLRQWLGGGKPLMDHEKKEDNLVLTGP